jgi:hypothetical protein
MPRSSHRSLPSSGGFFKEEDIDPEIIRMNANRSITALATGDTDYTTIFGSVVRATIRRPAGQSFLDSSTQMLLARQEYQSVKELKAKTLGVSTSAPPPMSQRK